MFKLLQKRSYKLLLACISLIFLLNMIQETYAKYISSADASSNLTIAKWAFTVNEQDVLANNDFSNTIVPTFETNEHIKNGVIAPTSVGYFDITIDSSEVGVSFDEVITLTKNNTNSVSDLIFTGYKKNNGELIELSDQNTISINTTHLLDEEQKTNTYRFYIKWNDDEQTQNMNNAADTQASVDGVASVNINLQFIQKAN